MAIDPFFGSLIGAGSSLLGSLFGGNSNDRAADHAANQMAKQEEFAQKGLMWRAMDAMNAYKYTGIHPLQILGSSGASYSPVSVQYADDNNVGTAIGKAGQSIEKGIYAAADQETRNAALARSQELHRLAVERGGLENDLLKLQIASQASRMSQSPSVGLPSARTNTGVEGQVVNSGRFVKDEGMARRVVPNSPAHGPMQAPSVEWSKNSDGSYTPMRSKAFADRSEDDFFQSAKHFVVNTLGPMISPSSFASPYPAPPGKKWYVDFKGDWRLVDRTDQLHRSRYGPGMRR